LHVSGTDESLSCKDEADVLRRGR